MNNPADGAPPDRRAAHKRRRMIVVVVPPVDELDLVGPLQVFSSVNRLAAQPVYSVEIVANSRQRRIPCEAGLLTFLAQGNLQSVKGKFDSVLLVCGVASRNTRDPALFTWLRRKLARSSRLAHTLAPFSRCPLNAVNHCCSVQPRQ